MCAADTHVFHECDHLLCCLDMQDDFPNRDNTFKLIERDKVYHLADGGGQVVSTTVVFFASRFWNSAIIASKSSCRQRGGKVRTTIQKDVNGLHKYAIVVGTNNIAIFHISIIAIHYKRQLCYLVLIYRKLNQNNVFLPGGNWVFGWQFLYININKFK